MPAKDVYHACVKNALIKDGWKITHDPYTMTFGVKDVFADLGAEKPLAAEKGEEKILVEILIFAMTRYGFNTTEPKMGLPMNW
jgi:hypothetical protein